jgi:hypothetical protein
MGALDRQIDEFHSQEGKHLRQYFRAKDVVVHGTIRCILQTSLPKLLRRPGFRVKRQVVQRDNFLQVSHVFFRYIRLEIGLEVIKGGEWPSVIESAGPMRQNQ